MKFFDVDGPLYKLMTSLTNIFVLNMCLLISFIPIVTAGPGIVAAYYVCLKMVDNEEGYIVKQFISALKSNFKQGLILEIITLLCAYVVYLDFQIFEAVETNPIIFLIIGIVSAFLFTLSLIYAYPQVARYKNTIPNIIRNSFRISMKYFVRTLMVVVVVFIESAAFIWNTMMLFIGFLIGPACIIYTISAVAKPIFLQIEKDKE